MSKQHKESHDFRRGSVKTYRAAVIGCSRMGAFIDNEVPDYEAIKLPYSHAAGFFAEERIDLIACADLRPEVMEHFGNRYSVPKANQYTDYREMLEKEQPDIVSVATQPEHRAEIVVYAAEHGVKAIYAEKAMAASMDEAAAMVSAVEGNNVAFNLGTNRRWHTGFDKMKEIIDSGEIGKLRTLIIYSNSTLFNSASHHFDLILRLNSDVSASWITGYLPEGDSVFDGNELRADPSGGGTIQFENGVTAHALLTPRGSEWEAICDGGTVTCWNNGWQWHLRKRQEVPGWRTCQVPETFPPFENTSSTANLVKDLVQSLDTGEPTRGGVRCAYASTELIFGIIESHLHNGARIELPLKDSKVRLQRNPTARQPRVE